MNQTGWDIFISYASEERLWVVENVYRPLLQCRTAEGRRPRIFLDAGEEGIGPGDDWLLALANALNRSRRIVPVYSALYFSKRMCQWELRKAVNRLLKEDDALVPILLEPSAAKDVPDLVSHIQYLDVRTHDWFSRLRPALGLSPQTTLAELRFLNLPKGGLVSHTLPAFEVGVFSNGHLQTDEEEISIAAEGCSLRGTTTLQSEAGIARFSDLSVGEEHRAIRFVVTAEGCTPAVSGEISIASPEPEVIPDSMVRICDAGEPVFFEDSAGLALISAETITVYAASGTKLAAMRFDGQMRVMRRARNAIALATWQGTVLLATSDGFIHQWDLSRPDGLATVPGDLAFDRSSPNICLYAGLWTGDIYQLAPGKDAELALHHEGGVQALAWDRLQYVWDLKGDLIIYNGSQIVAQQKLDRTVRGLKYDSGSIVAVGEKALYYLPSAESTLFTQSVKLGPIIAAYMEPPSSIAMDASGRGLVFDRDLFILHGVHLGAGAVPVCADQQGRCIYRVPGGSYDLVVGGKTIYHHVGGVLAVALRGDLWAVGNGYELRIVPGDAMDVQLVKESRAQSF